MTEKSGFECQVDRQVSGFGLLSGRAPLESRARWSAHKLSEHPDRTIEIVRVEVREKADGLLDGRRECA